MFLIIVLGFGGTFQNGYHNTGLSSPSPVRELASPLAVGLLLTKINIEAQIKKKLDTKLTLFAAQFILSFINSTWSHRYEEAPPPHTVTMIWSLIVSLYGLGAFLGSLSINFVSGMLGR